MAGRNSYDLTPERGIRQRHENRCDAKNGRRCVCRPPAYIATATVAGRRIYSPTLRSIDDARRWRSLALTGQLPDLEPDIGPTVREVWAQWYDAAEAGVALTKSGTAYRATTLEDYDGAMRTHYLPIIGDGPMSHFDGARAQAAIDQLAAAGVSPSRQASGATAIRALGRWAARRGLGNRIRELELPRVPTRQPSVLAPCEVDHALRMLPSADARLYAALAAYTGARALEIAAIETDDLDDAARTIYIRGTKTQAATRTVPIVDALRPYLAEHAAGSDGRLFPGSTLRGVYALRQRKLKDAWEGMDERPTLHTLRHNWVSWMLAAGMPLPAVQEISGHTTPLAPGVTLRIYGHATTDHVDVARRTMDAWIATQSTAE